MNPAIEQLCRLCRLGFTGERLFNQDGHLELVHYTRHFRGVREVVLVYSEPTALAYRTRDMLDLESPLDVTENAIEWRLHGDVVTVVNALLSLPTPGPTVIDSTDAAARALGDFFLANADRGDNAANDELVAELVRWRRAQRGSGDGRG